MERQRGIKALSVVALLIAVVGLSVAFAAMSRTLTINGTATVDPATWDVHFENLVKGAVLGGAEVTAEPTIGEANGVASTHIGDYAVKLTKPGDSVTYTFDVVNEGDINATLTSYVKATPTFAGADEDVAIVEENLVYTLTYADGSAITEGAALAKTSGVASFKLVVAYDSEADVLPAAPVTIEGMDVTMVYTQAD